MAKNFISVQYINTKMHNIRNTISRTPGKKKKKKKSYSACSKRQFHHLHLMPAINDDDQKKRFTQVKGDLAKKWVYSDVCVTSALIAHLKAFRFANK